jgi:hypothetical protein
MSDARAKVEFKEVSGTSIPASEGINGHKKQFISGGGFTVVAIKEDRHLILEGGQVITPAPGKVYQAIRFDGHGNQTDSLLLAFTEAGYVAFADIEDLKHVLNNPHIYNEVARASDGIYLDPARFGLFLD